MSWFTDLFKTGKKAAQDKAEEIINSDELKEIIHTQARKSIVDAINKKIDIPIMTERQEGIMFGFFYDALTNGGIKFIKEQI